MSFWRTWLWKNALWRLEDERCRHDEYFRGHCKFTFNARPRLAGRKLDRLQIQSLCMAPKGSTIIVSMDAADVVMQVAHPTLITQGAVNEFKIKADGATNELYLYIELAMFKNGPKGMGAVGFLRCAQMCLILGLRYVKLLAAGGKSYKIDSEWNADFNGFYSWARFGFNAPLHPHTRHLIATQRPLMQPCHDLIDVISRDPLWWQQEGGGGEMTFDLQQGSRSWQTLNSYLKQSGYRR